jgi:hypothetical protein
MLRDFAERLYSRLLVRSSPKSNAMRLVPDPEKQTVVLLMAHRTNLFPIRISDVPQLIDALNRAVKESENG